MGGLLRSFLASRTARIASATALVFLSMWFMRFGMHGWCLWSVSTVGLIGSSLLAAPVFAGAFIWFFAELASSQIERVGLSGRVNLVVAVVFAVSVYSAVGAVGWMTAPSEYSRYLVRSTDSHAPMWVFWSMGFLISSGNFSDVHCGY